MRKKRLTISFLFTLINYMQQGANDIAGTTSDKPINPIANGSFVEIIKPAAHQCSSFLNP